MSTAQRSKGGEKKTNPNIELVGKNKQGLPAVRLQSRRCVLTGFSSIGLSTVRPLNPAADRQLSFGPFWSTPCFIKAFQTDAGLQENCRFIKYNGDEKDLYFQIPVCRLTGDVCFHFSC